ncbi:MAG: hypothetical protein K2O94_00025 [Clostridiales bacterium]|nr:hypothetical protein [Clostridiales bacterium]
MINNVKGVMAGIGDMLNDVNVIEPGFDARVYRYIIGKDCIIEGLEMSGNTLSAGICIGQGYRGYLPTSCEIGTIYDYIYAHFKVHHDRDIEDEFWIECTKSSTVVQNDILHNAGDYWLLLYQKVNGKWQKRIDDIKYPLRSQHSDDTMRVVEHGVLEDGVTAVTQEVGDKTDKVATTEFVQNQIAEDIDAGFFNDSKHNVGLSTIFDVEINLRRRAKFVLLDVKILIKQQGSVGSSPQGMVFIQIPEGFRPTKDYTIGELTAAGDYVTDGKGYIHISTDGNIYLGDTVQSTENAVKIYPSPIGYETN